MLFACWGILVCVRPNLIVQVRPYTLPNLHGLICLCFHMFVSVCLPHSAAAAAVPPKPTNRRMLTTRLVTAWHSQLSTHTEHMCCWKQHGWPVVWRASSMCQRTKSMGRQAWAGNMVRPEGGSGKAGLWLHGGSGARGGGREGGRGGGVAYRAIQQQTSRWICVIRCGVCGHVALRLDSKHTHTH